MRFVSYSFFNVKCKVNKIHQFSEHYLAIEVFILFLFFVVVSFCAHHSVFREWCFHQFHSIPSAAVDFVRNNSVCIFFLRFFLYIFKSFCLWFSLDSICIKCVSIWNGVRVHFFALPSSFFGFFFFVHFIQSLMLVYIKYEYLCLATESHLQQKWAKI